jgi:dTMP kinase
MQGFQRQYGLMWRSRQHESGKLIAICGFDGSGKTTQIQAITDRLRAEGRALLLTRQPSDWYRSDAWVRGFLDTGKQADSRALALFAAADRRRHVTELVDPALSRNEIVLTDRYVYSSLAYFSVRGVAMEETASINIDLPKPDLAVFLDVEPEVCLERIRRRDGGTLKFEEIDIAKIRKIREAYLRIAEIDDEFVVLDGQRSPAETSAQIESLASW